MPVGVIIQASILGVSVIASKFLSKPPKLKPFVIGERTATPRENKITVRSSIDPHRIIYGETVVAGSLKAVFNTGANKEYLHLIIVLAGHECNAITDVWLGDDLSTASKFSGLVNIYQHLGSPDQTYDTNLATDVSQWTSAHRLRGLCYLYVKLKWDANVWLSGIPNIKARVQGRKVLDIRTGTTAYSTNAALCKLDYLRSDFGVAVPDSKIDTDSWVAAANICDEDVPLLAGGTQKRYTCNGSFTLDQKPIDITNNLRTALHGMVVRQGGKYYTHAGVWVAPVITLNEDDLRGDISFQAKPNRRSNYNAVKGTFIDSASFNQATDFIPRTNATYETDDGGARLYRDLELPFTTNHIIAQRIAQIELEQSRLGTLVYPASLRAFDLACGDRVYVNNTILGWNQKTFRILDWTLAEDFGVDLLLQEDNATVWGWSSSQEASLDTPPTPALPDPYTVATPTGLTLTSVGESLQNTDGGLLYRLKANWTLLTNEFVSSGGQYEVQYKKSTDSTYVTYALVAGDIASLYINGVKNAVSYDVRIRAINRIGVKSAFATVINHTVATITSAPATPTGLVATGYATSIRLTWSANAESDIEGYVIERADNASFTSGLVTISRPLSLSYLDELGTRGTQKYYRIYARNRSGNLSSATTGVNATTDGITTARVNDNAINALTTSSTDGEVTIDSSEVEIGSVTITPDNGFCVVLGVTSVYSPTWWNYFGSIRLWKGAIGTGTLLDQKNFSFPVNNANILRLSVTVMGIDPSPGVSASTYRMSGITPSGFDGRCYYRRMEVRNHKK